MSKSKQESNKSDEDFTAFKDDMLIMLANLAITLHQGLPTMNTSLDSVNVIDDLNATSRMISDFCMRHNGSKV